MRTLGPEFKKARLHPGPERNVYTPEQVENCLLAAEYRFAKTMPEHPHYYTLREHWTQPVPFDDVVQFIRDHGYQERYGNQTYTYMNIGPDRYWTMGYPLHVTKLINRARRKDYSAPGAGDTV